VEVSKKPKEERRETRRRLEILPASLRPYIVLSIRKTMYDVGLAGGVSLDEGGKVKVGENSGRELLGKTFDILGRVEGSANVKVRQVNFEVKRIA
jgi:hypothetical protein